MGISRHVKGGSVDLVHVPVTTYYFWYRVAEIVRGIVYLNDPAVVDLVIDVSAVCLPYTTECPINIYIYDPI